MRTRVKETNRQIRLKWEQWGFRMGRVDAGTSTLKLDSLEQNQCLFILNELWVQRLRSSELLKLSLTAYNAAVKGYIEGYCQLKEVPATDWILLPTDQTVGAIISLDKHEKTAQKLLQQLTRLPLKQVICIVSGANQKLIEFIRQESTATIVYYDEPISPEIARAIGAKLIEADILLFLDGRDSVTAEQILPFIMEIVEGTDVALNDAGMHLQLQEFSKRNMLPVTKQFINFCLGRPDLGAASLEETPHVLTKAACETIHPANLVIPSKAHVLAVTRGLEVRPVKVSLGQFKQKLFTSSQISQVLSDHIEAMRLLINERGMRLHFPDEQRQRSYAEGGQQLADNKYYHSEL